MKNDEQMVFRLDAALLSEFTATCATAGLKQAPIIRDLIRAAIPYIQQMGRWYPPRIVPDEPRWKPPAYHPHSAEPPAGGRMFGQNQPSVLLNEPAAPAANGEFGNHVRHAAHKRPYKITRKKP